MSYKINDDFIFDGKGNLTVRGSHIVSHRQLKEFFDWLHQAPGIHGQMFDIKEFAFGCQRFRSQQLTAVQQAFEEERWKRPVEEEYTVGDRFEFRHTEYMYANVDQDRYNLINSVTGWRMFTTNIKKDNKRITLKELNSHSHIISGIKPKE